jgi:predicted aspartyl protease
MSQPFDPTDGRVVAVVEIVGPIRTHNFRFALDTGATRTAIRPRFLQALGCDLSAASPPVRLRSATGGGQAGFIKVSRFSFLGVVRTGFPLVIHDLPPAVAVDGLLGLDFLRGHVLTLDFHHGRMTLRPPRPWWRPWN